MNMLVVSLLVLSSCWAGEAKLQNIPIKNAGAAAVLLGIPAKPSNTLPSVKFLQRRASIGQPGLTLKLRDKPLFPASAEAANARRRATVERLRLNRIFRAMQQSKIAEKNFFLSNFESANIPSNTHSNVNAINNQISSFIPTQTNTNKFINKNLVPSSQSFAKSNSAFISPPLTPNQQTMAEVFANVANKAVRAVNAAANGHGDSVMFVVTPQGHPQAGSVASISLNPVSIPSQHPSFHMSLVQNNEHGVNQRILNNHDRVSTILGNTVNPSLINFARLRRHQPLSLFLAV